MVPGLAGTNTNTTHHSPTFQCEAMRVSAKHLQGGYVSPSEKKQYPGVSSTYVQKKNQQPQTKNNQHTSTTPRANKISSFYDDVLYILLLYRFALQYFPSWKWWTELKVLRAGHRRKGLTRSERRNRKHALGWHGRDCRRGISRGLPAVLKTWEHDSVLGEIRAYLGSPQSQKVTFGNSC